MQLEIDSYTQIRDKRILDLFIDEARINCQNLISKTGDEVNIVINFKIMVLDKILIIPGIIPPLSDNDQSKPCAVQITNTKPDQPNSTGQLLQAKKRPKHKAFRSHHHFYHHVRV